MRSVVRSADSRLTGGKRLRMLTTFASVARTFVEEKSRARSSVVEHLAFNQRVVGSIPTGLTSPPRAQNHQSVPIV